MCVPVVSPENIPTDEYIVATEQACKFLTDEESHQLRAKVAGLLHSAKPPQSNLSKRERQVLGNLAKNRDITILPADKGKATVIMDTAEYESKVKEMLGDRRIYEVLQSDPTLKYKKDLISKLSKLKQEGKITEQDYEWLYPIAENVPRMYCTPKIHKEGNPLRPIVDYTGSIGYRTSRALAGILAPIVGKSEHHLNNSKDLANDMNSIMVEEDEMFISHDVVSLFTNTPIDLALQVIRERLEGDKELHTRTHLAVEDIMDLLKFIVTTTYFSFRGVIYQQKFGTVSPLLAYLFMEWLEKQVIATAPVECKPKPVSYTHLTLPTIYSV